MLDIKQIRANIDEVKERLATRGFQFDVAKFTELDQKRSEFMHYSEGLKAEQNAASKNIPEMKKNGEDVSKILEEMKVLSDKAVEAAAKAGQVDDEIKEFLMFVPNIPDETVPFGKDETENVEIRRWEPDGNNGTDIVLNNFKNSHNCKPHWELGESLNILDVPTAAKVTGSRFTFYRDQGARLERSIGNYYLDTHSETNGYTEVFPPFIVNSESMRGTGQLPKFAEDMFKLEGLDYYLIPTAEVPVTNMYRDQILDAKDLPIKHCAYSACFRAEAGSAGRDTRGLIRQHQFNKVELVKFALPEKSYEELESLTIDAEKVLQGLGIPYRVIALSTGDLGFCSAKTYDIEVWMPSYGRYVEISSCSNFEDYQARRANLKFRRAAGDKPELLHTLNGSGVALGRTTAAIIENYQLPDGTIRVPEVLRKYFNKDLID